MKTVNFRIILLFLFTVSTFLSCKKEDEFLNAVPMSNQKVPASVSDVALLLKDQRSFNIIDPGYLNVSCESIYVADTYFATLNVQNQNSYLFAKEQFPLPISLQDWNTAYQAILKLNINLETLNNLTIDNANDKVLAGQVKATALFYRSWIFFNLVREFSLPFDSATSNTQLGIPLRLNSSSEIQSTRSSEKECYDRIIGDLTEAVGLLPIKTSDFTQPSQTAGFGLLARIYLSIGNYSKAFEYADKFLGQFSTLTDYNTLSPKMYTIGQDYLSEDVYHSVMTNATLSTATNTNAQVDTLLYASYDANDLRQSLFFNVTSGRRYFRGSYDVMKNSLYSGIATDEMYLIRSECYARANNPTAALADLNTLLSKRYKTGKFTPYTTAAVTDILGLILKERNKELFMRGTRWSDLRRLNKEGKYPTTIIHIVKGVQYTLPPNDPRYALSIPQQEIIASGIPQNPR